MTSQPIFGKRTEPHTIIIARGDRIRHFQIRPWAVAALGCALGALAIGYLTATTYLVLRDDLIGAATSRQARVQQAYEDRIAALRAQVDRITSRQLIDQQLMESKVSELLDRQAKLTQRHGRLGPILERAGEEIPASQKPKLDKKASLNGGATTPVEIAALWKTRTAAVSDTSADKADKMFLAINKSLRSIESEQIERVESLAANAYQTADAISEGLASAGLKVSPDFDRQDVGGPLVAVGKSDVFDLKVQELDAALQMLEDVKAQARSLPIANPAPGRPVSSTFGIRKDPIIGAPALHAGLDFRATTGTPIRVTAPGTVVAAGWAGGYGRMVEVDHGNGYSTRYAHMSRIDVHEGDRLEPGNIVGRVGSTGRSTGPHLHYEVRHNGTAVDPVRFIRAGKKVSDLL